MTQLDFRARGAAWYCGRSYRIRRNCINHYETFFYDWHNGWIDTQAGAYTDVPHLNPATIQDAIYNCTHHAMRRGWYKYCPKQTPGNLTLSGAALAAASALAGAAWL
jgi:hypothetical protein